MPNRDDRLVLDLETTSLADLRVVGSSVYASDPSTRVTVLCYALGRGPVRTWTGGPCPDDLRAAIVSGCVVVAHNYLFELNIWAAVLAPLGFPPIRLNQWSCTMARALVAGLPASLELAGHALGLAIQKDASARDLMLRFARPRSLNPLTWWHETDPARFAHLVSYCAQDVAAERELDGAVPELSPREYEIFLADHAINQRGVRVDLSLVDRMRTLSDAEKLRINDRINRLTNGQITSGAQVGKLVTWLTDNDTPVPMLDPGHGKPPRPTLGREAVEGMLARPGLPSHVSAVLRCRRDVSRSSTAKLTTIRNRVSADGRVRGGFQYYGASRTGRWAGRGVQWQNFPRGTIKDPHAAVDLVNEGATVEDLDLLFEDSPMGVLASMLRSVIEAAPGHMLVSCDLSQIEARVLVWLAGQDDVTALFARGEDVYTYTAKSLGSDNRQFGKVLVLATGFGMGPRRFRDTARTFGVTLTEGEAEDAVAGWRGLNHHVVHMWWEAHKIALAVAAGPVGSAVSFRGMVFARRPQSLDIVLPSGRALVYREPHVRRHPDHGHLEFVYRGVEQGRWAWVRSWPGKLTENIVQAIARDVMAEAIIKVHRRGPPLIATVHDELISEVPAARAEDARDWLSRAMNRAPVWAPGLPVAAAATIGRRYRKDA
jgi:DNA polymerase